MEGRQTSDDGKLEIPRLDTSRRRFLTIAAGVVLALAAVAVYLLTRGPAASPYRGAQVMRASIVKEIRVTGQVELTDQVEVPSPIEGQLVEV
ncbi:MAG: hypothetical protein JRE81_04115, partial [Deltaproteobacteria bacterium]|nr:hypothetical protein [Deltaproteobacteria bacterium]